MLVLGHTPSHPTSTMQRCHEPMPCTVWLACDKNAPIDPTQPIRKPTTPYCCYPTTDWYSNFDRKNPKCNNYNDFAFRFLNLFLNFFSSSSLHLCNGWNKTTSVPKYVPSFVSDKVRLVCSDLRYSTFQCLCPKLKFSIKFFHMS